MEHRKRQSFALKIFSFCFACGIIFASAGQASFIFSRTELTIHPVVAPPDYSKPRSAERKPTIRMMAPITLKVEIRPSSTLQSPSLYLTRPLADNDAYLIQLPSTSNSEKEPKSHLIQPANVYSPIDLIAIDPKGIILRIWPRLKLNELQTALALPLNTHAILTLAPNRAEQLGITTMDRVENELFTPEPTTL